MAKRKKAGLIADSQESRVLVALNSGKVLTQDDALAAGTSNHRLAATIHILRKKGFPIEGTGTPSNPYRMPHARVDALKNGELPLFKDGWVYFIQSSDGGRIKIGWAKDVDARLRDLKTGNASDLTVLAKLRGSREDEADMHRKFKDSRVRTGPGGEWFNPTPDLLSFVSLYAEQGVGS